jgi:hypothetical protein
MSQGFRQQAPGYRFVPTVRPEKLLGPLGEHPAELPALAPHAASPRGFTRLQELPAARDRERLARWRPDGVGRRAGQAGGDGHVRSVICTGRRLEKAR